MGELANKIKHAEQRLEQLKTLDQKTLVSLMHDVRKRIGLSEFIQISWPKDWESPNLYKKDFEKYNKEIASYSENELEKYIERKGGISYSSLNQKIKQIVKRHLVLFKYFIKELSPEHFDSTFHIKNSYFHLEKITWSYTVGLEAKRQINRDLHLQDEQRTSKYQIPPHLVILDKDFICKKQIEACLALQNHAASYLKTINSDRSKTPHTTSIPDFIDVERLVELESLKHSQFDLTKLIQYCKELNMAYKCGNFLTVPLIGRAILDHVPPIFGQLNFESVCSQHGNKSFKQHMTHLEKSLRKIADGFLHTQIRKREILPTRTQVDFSQDFDALIGEILRLLKE